MRNKHNEGYTLPLVMVVLLVLAIVAVTIMTTSLKNMLRQQQFIDTMKDQYAAQGQIEKIVAQLQAGQEVEVPFEGTVDPVDNTLSGTIVVGNADGSVMIKCGIEIKGSSVTKTSDGYTIVDMEPIKYTSYEIIKGGGG